MNTRASRAIIAVVLASVLALALWFASPQTVQSLNMTFPVLPASGTLGQTYSFTVRVNVEDRDVLPIQSAELEIRNQAAPTTYFVTCPGLPLADGNASYPNISVTATTGAGWGRAQSANRTAFWGGYGYSLVDGYGYGYLLGSGNTSITYAITWTPPTNWPAGYYYAVINVRGDSGRVFSQNSPNFNLVQPAGGFGGGGGGGGGAPAGPGVTSLIPYTNDEGVFAMVATVPSSDGRLRLSFPRGVKATTKDGGALRSISINQVSDPPAPPPNTQFVGLVYELGPEGATFVPAVTLTITYDPAGLPAGVQEKNLILARWDAAAGKWVDLQGNVETATRSISVAISRFSRFAIMVQTRPAAFTISDLTIAPAQARSGQAININVRISNSGDLAGIYKVTLKVNGAVEATRDVSVSGGSTETVTFSTTRDVGGAYSVDLNGLTGSFTIESVVVATPATFKASGLSINPQKVLVGQTVTVSFTVTNTGQQTGTYRAALTIDDKTVEVKEVSVAAGASETISFSIVRDRPGVNVVEVGGLSGTIEVTAAQPVTTPAINWWIIGGLVAFVAAVAVFVWMSLRRRAA